MILDDIVKQKRKEIARIGMFPKLQPTARQLTPYLKGKHNIIAEIKRASPSTGKLFQGNVKKIATIYDQYANALSVVTDKKFFGGDVTDMRKVRAATQLPILRKDFIIDERQIHESRYYGADAILLIAALLAKEEIDRFIAVAATYNMDCVVEVHTEEELQSVLQTNAHIIGINNRDLHTFTVDTTTTTTLQKLIPKEKIIVSESGITTQKQVRELNTHAVLIGTSLLQADNTAKKLQSLHIPKVKVCGITRKEDATTNTDFLGFNFYKKSPRYITPAAAKKIIATLPNTVTTVGVFVNEPNAANIAAVAGVDMIQLHGNEPPEACNLPFPVIKAFHVDTTAPDVSTYNVFACLFDTKAAVYGGSGETFQHDLITTNKKTFIAGGITPENIPRNTYCVDACSSIERAPGVKDNGKVQQLIEAVHGQ